MIKKAPEVLWFDRGQRAMAALEQARYGDREAMFDNLAKSFGVSAQTLRRDTAVVRFVLTELNSMPDLAKRLQDVPMAAIEHVARWHRHDPEAALRAAEKVADGKLSVRGVELAEKAGRDTTKPGGQGRRPREQVFREAIVTSLEGICGKVDPYGTTGSAVPYDYTWWVGEPHVDPAITFIVMGPYTDRSRYPARRVDYCLRADWHHRHRPTVLMLADPEYVEFYLYFRNANQLHFHVFASTTGRFELSSPSELNSLIYGSLPEAIVPFRER